MCEFSFSFTIDSRDDNVGYRCPSSFASLNSQLLLCQSGTIVSSPSELACLPQMTERTNPHHASKKLMESMIIAIKVTVMTPIPMTFHSVSSAGGVVDVSPIHPVVAGTVEDDTILE